MEINKGRLPEKKFYTFKEISVRWGCDVSDIEYYVFDQNILRAVANLRETEVTGLLRFPNNLPVASDHLFATYCEIKANAKKHDGDIAGFGYPSNLISDPTDGIPHTELYSRFNNDTQYRLPTLIYFFPLEEREQFCVSGLDVSGNEYLLLRSFFLDIVSNTYSDLEFTALSVSDFKYISKDERDRFEIATGMRQASPTEELSPREKEIGETAEDSELTNAFPSRRLDGIAIMFPLKEDNDENLEAWKKLAGFASKNGLVDARVKKGTGRAQSLFDPWIVSEWLVKNNHITQARINRILASNLPPGSEDLKVLILS